VLLCENVGLSSIYFVLFHTIIHTLITVLMHIVFVFNAGIAKPSFLLNVGQEELISSKVSNA